MNVFIAAKSDLTDADGSNEAFNDCFSMRLLHHADCLLILSRRMQIAALRSSAADLLLIVNAFSIDGLVIVAQAQLVAEMSGKIVCRTLEAAACVPNAKKLRDAFCTFIVGNRSALEANDGYKTSSDSANACLHNFRLQMLP